MRIHRLLVAAGAVSLTQFTVAPAARAQQADSVRQARATCDGSVRSARNRREQGTTVARSGLLAMIASIPIGLGATSSDPRHPPSRTRLQVGQYVGLAGVIAQITGTAVAGTGGVSLSEWDDALQRLRIGESTSAEVDACLGKPTRSISEVTTDSAGVAATTETSWEYRARFRNSFFGRHYSRVVTIAFRDSVVSGIKVTETR